MGMAAALLTLATLGPRSADAQSCDCSQEQVECCAAWGRTREWEVRATITASEVTIGSVSLPEAGDAPHLARAPSAARAQTDVPRPDPLDPGGLLPAFPLPIAADDEALGAHAARYHELLALEARPGQAEQAHALSLRLQRALGSDGGEDAKRWLLIGELRRRQSQRAYERTLATYEACTAREGESCPARPRWNRSSARRAFESAAQHGRGTPLAAEALLRAGEMMIGTRRGADSIRIFEGLADSDDERVARRAHARLAEARLMHGQGSAGLAQLDEMGHAGDYGPFVAYARVAGLAEGGRARALFDAAMTALGVEALPGRYRASVIAIAAVAAAELGRWTENAFEAAPASVRPALHAALAEVAWEAGHANAAAQHARAGMSAFAQADRAHWRQRIEEHGSAEAAPPPAMTGAPTAPTEEAGMIAWLAFAVQQCMRQAAETSPPFHQGRVRWEIRLHRESMVSRPRARAPAQGMDALLSCLREAPAPPVQPRRSTEIDADLALSNTP